MSFFSKGTPVEKEWRNLIRQEQRFYHGKQELKEGFINKTLEGKVPQKLQDTLNTAFQKAFSLVFEKGTGVIEKTYSSEKIKQNYRVRSYAAEVKKDRKSIGAFSKEAQKSSTQSVVLSGASGIGMGVLGIGLPDIPVFTAMILRNLYKISMHYGYDYKTPEEKYFILLLIQGGVSSGENFFQIDQKIKRFLKEESQQTADQVSKQINETAETLARELLYMKFLQGIPIIGAVGGVYDAFFMKQIAEYAQISYQRRYLLKLIHEK